jgi:hypothetical protein
MRSIELWHLSKYSRTVRRTRRKYYMEILHTYDPYLDYFRLEFSKSLQISYELKA